MKKILLATTVLGMSAGFAVAEVAVSGSARMGIVSTDGDSAFSSRVRMSFTGKGTTDGGLEFGGSFDAHNSQGANAGSSGSTYISGAFGKISMGDVSSGDAKAVGQLASVGYTGLGSTNSINYAAQGVDGFGLNDVAAGSASIDNQTGDITLATPAFDNISDAGGAKVLYTYAAGGISVSASTAQLTNGGSTAYGVGAAYTTGALTVAVGDGSNDATYNNIGIVVDDIDTDGGAAGDTALGDTEVIADGFDGTVKDSTVSATYVMGATTIMGIYQLKSIDLSRPADLDDDGVAILDAGEADVTDGELTSGDAIGLTASATSMGMSVSHSIDALTLTAFSLSTELDLGDLAGTGTITRSGLGVAYDLGGGATVKAGWVNANTVDFVAPSVDGNDLVDGSITDASYNVMDVGVSFKF
jgi:outer membrane protein OmpU